MNSLSESPSYSDMYSPYPTAEYKTRQQYEEIKQEIFKLRYIIHRQDVILNRLLESSKKMDNHITFIESVYTIIKSPFQYAVDFVNYITHRTPDSTITEEQHPARLPCIPTAPLPNSPTLTYAETPFTPPNFIL